MSMFDKAILTLPGAPRMLALLVASALAKALLVVGQAWSVSHAIVNLWHGLPVEGQLGWVAAFLACFVGRQLVGSARDRLIDAYAYRRADELRERLLDRAFAVGPALAREQGTGSLTTSIIEGVDQVESYMALLMPKIADLMTIPPALVIALFALDWVSGVIALVAFPCIVLFMVILGSTARDEAARQHARYQVLANHFVDSLRGLETLRSFGRARQHGRSVFSVSEDFRAATMRTLRVATLSSAVLDLFTTLSLAAVSIMMGFRLVDGTLAFLPALTALLLVPEYFRPIREFAADFHATLDGKNALASILRVVEAPEEPVHDVLVSPWAHDSVVELRDVRFAYPGASRDALTGVSLRVRGRMKVGIVGASGSGKSTLVALLGGFVAPSGGDVSVQGTHVPSLRVPDWQGQLTYIPQSPYVFHASLRDNVAFYRPDATRDQVRHAMEMVGLAELADSLPQGMDTTIGEGARALSGGQAQRIALARAFLDDGRRVLLFDEPTAHLDVETEMELKERMLPLMEGRLVFFATHRLHWMGDMDLVVVLEQGRVAQVGTPRELAADPDGAFARVAASLGAQLSADGRSR